MTHPMPVAPRLQAKGAHARPTESDALPTRFSWAAAVLVVRARHLARRVELAGQTTEGIARDIGPLGELIVDGEAFVAGSLTHL